MSERSMKIFSIHWVLGVCFLWLAPQILIAQTEKLDKKFEKSIAKAEENFLYGDYYQSQIIVKRLLNKYQKKGFVETQNYALASLYNAKFLVGLGKYFVVQDSIENAMFYFNSFVKKDSSKYGQGLLLISDIYSNYGNYVRAQDYLEKAIAYSETDPNNNWVIDVSKVRDTTSKKKVPEYTDPSLQPELVQNFEIEKRKLQIQIARGFYNESDGVFEDLIKYQSSISKRSFANVDSTAKKSVTKIKKKELKKRQLDLGLLFVNKADFLRLRGNYPKAASMYSENARVFDRMKISKKSFPYLKNTFGQMVMIENDGRLEKAHKRYKRLRSALDRSNQVSNYHKFYNEVVEHEIMAYIAAEKNKKAKDLFLKYKLDNMNKYGTKSIYYLHALMLENEFNNRKKRYKKAVKAEDLLKDGIEEVLPIDHIDNMNFNDHLYDFYKKNNKIEEARIEREANRDIAKINYGENAPKYSMALLELSNFNIDMQDEFSSSKNNYENHFEDIVEKQLHNHHPKYSLYLTYYARLKTYLDDYTAAYDLSSQAAKIADERFGASSEEYALALIEMASINIDKGEFDQAENQLERATELIKEEGSKNSLSNYHALMELAELYQISGKYDKADATIRKAHKYAKKSGENQGLSAASSDELAALYITQGRYKAAEDILKKSIELNEKKYGEEHYRLVKPYALYSKLYLVTGEYILSEKMIQKSLDISKTTLGDTSVDYMDNLTQLGEIYIAMGNYKEAREIYTDARKLINDKFGDNNYREAQILQQLADVNFKSDNSDLKIITKYLDEAKEIVTTNFSSSHPQYAYLLEYEAKVLVDYKEYDKAKVNLEDAQKIWLGLYKKEHINVAQNEILMGDLLYKKGEFAEALKNYSDASKTIKDVQDDNHPEYIETRSKMGKSLFAKGDLKGAMVIYNETTVKYLEYLDKYFPALSEQEKGRYWNSIKGDFETYNSLALAFSGKKGKTRKTVGKIYDFKLSTKAILLSSSAKLKNRIVNSGDGELLYKFGLYNEYREDITRGLSMSPSEREEQGIDLGALEKEVNSLEKELSEQSEDFADAFDSEQFTWKDVKATLKPNEYAIEIVRFRHWDVQFTDSIIYMAMIVHSKSKAPEPVILSNGNQLDSKFFKYYTNTIKYKVKDKKSYTQFWAEIDSKIPDDATIYVSADGVYNQMNIETLIDSSGNYLIDKNEIYYVSNTKDLVLEAKDETKKSYSNTAFLIGNPEFAGDKSKIASSNTVSSIEPLPGAEKEIKDVNKLLHRYNWKKKTLIGAAATETAIKEMESPRVFHVATHGFFKDEDKSKQAKEDKGDIADNPLLRSGLLFTGAGELLANNNIYDFNKKDGILTAYEAMNLNLDNTELVVLSACETGRGEIKSGEGVYGLQRSFLVAGADNVIMTLFKVNDAVTQELMNDFYAHWLEGENKRDAFQNAKKRIKEKYDKPIYWGSFMLIGLD
ncbi:MAG: CHAT domain-containing protein [Salibacteraceae bacterium]